MYNPYGQYCGYPMYIVTFGGHDFKFDDKVSADKFIKKLESRYAQHGLSVEGKYSMRQEWHSGF